MMNDDMKVSKGLAFPVVALPGVGRQIAITSRRSEFQTLTWKTTKPN
jgi:hypothetical protein